MGSHDIRALLSAVSGELSDIRGGVQQAGDLMGEVLGHLEPKERLAYLARTQAFDVLVQRLDALSSLANALSEDQPMDSALAALPLAEMAERLQEAAHRNTRKTTRIEAVEPAGELQLFD